MYKKRKLAYRKLAIFVVAIIALSAAIVIANENLSDEVTATDDLSPGIIYVDDDADPGWYNATHVKTIQEGIDNASSGDTVFVYNGTYHGSIDVDKKISLVGESAESTIIEAWHDVVEITADWVNFSRFTIKGHAGPIYDCNIKIGYNVYYVTIKDCILLGNGRGINMYKAFHCTVVNNKIQGAYDNLIKCWGACNNIIKCNTFNGCKYPIFLGGKPSDGYSNNNIIYCNNFMSGVGNPMDFDISTNVNYWDNGSVGNYWSAYSGNDANNDRIGDSSYSRRVFIDYAFTDHYPLMYPWGEIPPIADFWFSPSNPYQGDAVSFSCSFRDLDGYVVSYNWAFGDSGASVSQNPTYIYADAGSYIPRLTVVDNDEISYSISKSIHVLNHMPTANFVYSPINPKTSDTIHFTDQSTDSDGSVVSRYWNFDDGSTSSTKNPTHRFTDDGVYYVSLMVTDDDEGTDAMTKQITVENMPPSASFTYEPSKPLKLEIINFIDHSTDSDGRIVSWIWDFDDGEISYGQNPSHQYSDDGTYTVKLTVTDDDGSTDTTSQDIIVGNIKPTANFTYMPKSPVESDTTLTFIDSSIDPDGSIVNWTWDFDDGTTGYGDQIIHIYSKTGAYNVTLIVTDNDGDIDIHTATITVEKEEGIPAFEFAFLVIAMASIIVLKRKT